MMMDFLLQMLERHFGFFHWLSLELGDLHSSSSSPKIVV
jgi:hypothetical protein